MEEFKPNFKTTKIRVTKQNSVIPTGMLCYIELVKHCGGWGASTYCICHIRYENGITESFDYESSSILEDNFEKI